MRLTVVCFLGSALLLGLCLFAYYQHRLLDLREPVVETCVKHRVDQKVLVQ
jgi:hypothetical protein